ncbi:hypothetical protein PoB_004672600 [Plakobranchus ocellatus]|uniref:Uncharacterized protein n=1 Tax=Plakobranchus ocellatus TaxID=259542 RepID=A0AAV4BMI2_9GAST|nr:hypothetical protein PoB_004672600 [Plakobranchus ocellatus]
MSLQKSLSLAAASISDTSPGPSHVNCNHRYNYITKVLSDSTQRRISERKSFGTGYHIGSRQNKGSADPLFTSKKERQRAMSRTSVDLLTTVLITAATLISLQPVRCDDPEIVFNGLYHVVFKGSYLSRFHRCLCEEDEESCTIEYRLQTNLGYVYGYEVMDVDDENIEDPRSVDSYDSAFQCEPGAFGTEGTITCTRLRQEEPRCSMGSNPVCRSFRVPTTDRRCDASCVDIHWTGFFVSYENFPDDETPQQGLCDASTPVTEVFTTSTRPETTFSTTRSPDEETTARPANQTSTQGPGAGVSMKDEGGGGGGDSAVALGAGIGCAIIVLLVVIVGALLWRRKRSREASTNKPSMPYIPHLHASSSNAYNTASYDNSRNRKVSSHRYNPTTGNGSEYAGYLEPVHVYAHIIDDEDNPYANVDDFSHSNGKTTTPSALPSPPVTAAAAITTTGVTHVQQARILGPYDLASSITSPAVGEGEKKKKKLGVLGLGKKEKGMDIRNKGERGTDTSLAHDYNRLHAGRAGKSQEVSRSILARYNNPPAPPSTPLEVDSFYEVYDEEREEEEEGRETPESPNAYSMAGPVIDGQADQQAGRPSSIPHYENTGNPEGFVNQAFTPPEQSSHDYFDLEDYTEVTTEGQKGRGGQEH